MTSSSFLLRLAVIGLVGLGATSLAACGRKGDLETPSATKARSSRPVGIPVGPLAPEPERVKPVHKPFLLDPLL